MSVIKETRKLTGLSQAKLAQWLGVSKSLIQFAEKEERSLPSAASAKLYTIFLQLQQVQNAAQATRPGKATVTNPAKLASRHKRRMEFHRRSALALETKLQKLKSLHPQLQARTALFDAMKDHDPKGYKATDRDKTWIEMTEWFSKDRMPATGLEEQELIQDKIEVHEAYAEVHRGRWERFEGMKEV